MRKDGVRCVRGVEDDSQSSNEEQEPELFRAQGMYVSQHRGPRRRELEVMKL